MDSATLKNRLIDLAVPAVQWLERTGSTNDDAARWAAEGAPDGALVAADLQENGRGRLGRRWVTRPGGALAFSLILRPTEEERSRLELFSPLAALAVADGLVGLGLDPEVKWPNDVLLGGKKVCGILAEATWLGGELQALVVGIGVNIAPSSVPPPEEVMFPATCVEDHLGHHTERFDLLRACVAALLARRHQSRQEILSDWDKRLAFKGETVRVVPPGENALVGTLMGIDTQGFLRLKSGPGAERLISAGDLTLRLE